MISYQRYLNIQKRQSLSILNVITNVYEYYIEFKIDLNCIQEKRLPTDKYGFFVGKNQSSDGMITMLTGKSNINKIGEIQSFDGKERLSVWNDDFGDTCNAIR